MCSRLIIESIRHRVSDQCSIDCRYTQFRQDRISIIFGRNGCGKSSLLQMLYGSRHAKYNRCFFNGKYLDQPLFSLMGAAAFLPQEPLFPMYWKLSRFKNNSLYSQEFQSWVFELFPDYCKMRLSDLSGGELRLFELQYLISLKRQFLILDEPFVGLDPITFTEVLSLLQTLECGIILSSHLVKDLARLDADFFIMRDGGLGLIDLGDN